MNNLKTIAFIGDSITDSSWIKKNFVTQLTEILKIKADKLAVSGATVGRRKFSSDACFLDFSKHISPNDDLVFILGGTNDYGSAPGQAVPLGKEGDTSEYTFYGACLKLVKSLKAKVKGKPIIFASPFMRSNEKLGYPLADQNEFGFRLEDYRNAIGKTCAEEGAIFLDLYSRFLPLHPDNPLFNKVTDDGLHPNQIGHDYIASYLAPILGKFLE